MQRRPGASGLSTHGESERLRRSEAYQSVSEVSKSISPKRHPIAYRIRRQNARLARRSSWNNCPAQDMVSRRTGQRARGPCLDKSQGSRCDALLHSCRRERRARQ